MTPGDELGVMLQLKTLGSFELLGPGDDGLPVRLMGPQKPLALIAYLALAPGRRATRDHLAELLWRNVDPERARRTLRQTLFSVRQKLGDLFVSDGESVVLTASLVVDCQAFDAAREQGRIAEAWQLYTGHFIADFATAGSAPFEEWCERQRDRLRATWLGVGEELMRQTLLEHPREAAVVAARLLEEAPERPELWTMRLRALLLAGERMEARAEGGRLQQQFAQGDLSLTAEIRALIREINADTVVATVEEPGAWRRPELVGRESAFAVLLAEWQAVVRSRAGQAGADQMMARGGMWIVRGSPGIGKTMLLDEFSQRARGVGGQVLMVRARRVNAETPFALIATLCDAAASLPGALGVSPATAAILVEMSPALSSVFRSASPRTHPSDELLRLRTQATQELLAAIADERPTLIVVDDLHWADDASRQMLATLGESLPVTRLLLVVATRPSRRWLAPDTARFLDLPPLSLEQLELLIASVAQAEPPLLRELATALMLVSGGVPLLAVSALELALERHQLSITGESWSCSDPEELKRMLGQGGVLEKLLAGLSPAALKVITALAVADGALSEDVLTSSALADDIAGVSDELVQRGLVVHSAQGLEIAHDELADAALAIVRPHERSDILRRVGAALLRTRPASSPAIALAGRLLAQVGDDSATLAFERWLELAADPLRWRDPMRAAGEFLGGAASPHQLTRLARSVSWFRRFTRGYPQTARVVAGAAASLAFAVAARWTTLTNPAPSAIQLVEPATTDGFVWWSNGRTAIPVSLGAVFVDAQRLPTPRGPDSVTVAFEAERGPGRLQGRTARQAVDGRVTFDSLSLSASAVGRFVVRAAGLPPAYSRRFVFIRDPEHLLIASLRIPFGNINGQQIDSTNLRVVVRPGAPLTGALQLRSTTTDFSAALLAGAVALWGDRRTNFITLWAMPPHALDREYTAAFEDASGAMHQMRAPTKPGVYQLVVVYAAETEFRYVASGTNWILGEPVWNDGNDIADFTPAQIEELRTTGRTVQRVLVRYPRSRETTLNDRYINGTVIDVVVEPYEPRPVTAPAPRATVRSR